MKTREDYIAFAEANKDRQAYKRHMDRLFPQGWGVTDLADWLCRNKTGHGLAEFDVPTPIESVPHPQEVSEETSRVDARMGQYRQIFSADTPNDEMMLRILCRNEITIERMSDKADEMIENGRITSRDLQDVLSTVNRMSAESRSIQKDLGIDKPSRGEGQDAGLKLMDYVQQAKKVLHRQGIPIGCPNCYRAESKTVNLYGFLVWHLEDNIDWQFQWTCPRCKSEVILSRETSDDLRTMFGWNA